MQVCILAVVAITGGLPEPASTHLDCPPASVLRSKAADPSSLDRDEEWCEDAQGVRQGPYRATHMHDRKVDHVVEGSYAHGKKVGTWREWHEGQRTLEETYHNGLKDGPSVTYYQGGGVHERKLFVAGKRNGLQETWDGQGHLSSRVRMIDDREEGLYRDWDPAGNICNEGSYRHGKEVGLWTVCRDEGGPKARGRYQRGQREGRWTFFATNGKRTAVGHYHAGKRAGAWTFFARDGKTPVSQGAYRAGRRNGRWTIQESHQPAIVVACREGERQGELMRRAKGASSPAPRDGDTSDFQLGRDICAGKRDRQSAFDDYGYDEEMEDDL